MQFNNKLSKLLSLVEYKYKIYLALFIALLFLASTFQIIGINSLLPTVASFFDNGHEIKNEIISDISSYISLKFNISLFVSLLFISVFIIIFSNLIFILVIYLSSKLAFLLEQKLKIKISKKLLNSDYESFTGLNKENTMSMFILETQRFATLINSYTDIFSRVILIIFLLIYLLFFFSDAILLLLFLFGFYLIAYRAVRKKISLNSIELSKINENTLTILQELFNSFRELKIFNLSQLYGSKFVNISKKLMKIRFFTSFISSSPRYFLEIIIFLIILFFLLTFDSSIEIKDSLAKNAILFFILFKIIPLFQGLFSQYVVAQSNLSSIDIIHEFIFNSKLDVNKKSSENEKYDKENFLKVDFKNISYSINQKKILEEINLNISKKDLIGIIGESGVGKSVLLDVLMGFRKFSEGEIYLNDKKVSQNEIQNFFKMKCSLYSQNSGILNDTVLNNIILNREYDKKKLSKILEKCLLKDHIIDGQINSFYKRKMQSLSGGQIQRVLIARCLYKDPEILIIDEGLNQLDIENEIKLFKNLADYNITMIMVYHRISRSKNFNKIYKLLNKKLLELNVN